MMYPHARVIDLGAGCALCLCRPRAARAPAALRRAPAPTRAHHSAIAGAGQPTAAAFQGDPLDRGTRSFFASASAVSCMKNTRRILLVWQEPNRPHGPKLL